MRRKQNPTGHHITQTETLSPTSSLAPHFRLPITYLRILLS
ncbi:hypothetical protein CCHR01_00140 [Colletotrichum chrysophilum]|uniref:Uncharacterized protein n=1 Tax=Colletotrichum chrysophilum TaxID=1836956 RepID=A0AAD9B4K1_9PEZI|nr:hypothetical protein CCHR01_00140 [Colletotrichum chrysophilum]